MLYNVIGYDNQIIGQVEASDAVEAWGEAGKRYENILDVRQVEEPSYGEEEERQFREAEYYREKGFRIVYSGGSKSKEIGPIEKEILKFIATPNIVSRATSEQRFALNMFGEDFLVEKVLESGDLQIRSKGMVYMVTTSGYIFEWPSPPPKPKSLVEIYDVEKIKRQGVHNYLNECKQNITGWLSAGEVENYDLVKLWQGIVKDMYDLTLITKSEYEEYMRWYPPR